MAATGGGLAALVAAGAGPALPHELPTFPRVRLISVLPHPGEPASRILTVEVRDPSGQRPVAGAEVLVSGLEQERGSAVRLRAQWLAPTPQPGVHQGEVQFPGRGLWDLTVTVRGPYVGEAHFEVPITGALGRAESRSNQPELAFGWPGWRLLLLNWGHLLGFGLWVGVTALALANPGVSPRVAVALTWLALALGIGTGFNKMEYGTPFPRGLRLFDWDVPRIFFGREYLYTLSTKHALIVTALGMTAWLTREARRGAPPQCQPTTAPGASPAQPRSRLGNRRRGRDPRPAPRHRPALQLTRRGLRSRDEFSMTATSGRDCAAAAPMGGSHPRAANRTPAAL